MQRLERKKIGSQIICLSLLLVIVTILAVVASNGMPIQQTSQFPRIEQPFLLKLAVTLGGVALICLELWWCLFNQNRSTTD